MEKKIRCLKPNEIEIRCQQVTAKGVQLLLYKDSRCDKRILDETFGINGWKNHYEEIKGNLYCTIEIWDDENKQWISKQDCGTESNSEKEKGEASDAFKRAGFNVGIGRELYTRLFYFASVPTKQNGTDKNGKAKYELEDKYTTFSVSKLKTNEETEKIEEIEIVDNNNKVVFTYPRKAITKKETVKDTNIPTKKMDEPIEMVEAKQIQIIHTLFTKIEKSESKVFNSCENDKAKEYVYKKFGVTSSKELTKFEADKMIKQLKSKVGE